MKSIAFCSVLISLAGTLAAAQSAGVPANACDLEFARFLVTQQVSESRSVTDGSKRIRILVRAADFLWKFDEATARSNFAEAFKIAVERFRERGFEEKRSGEG